MYNAEISAGSLLLRESQKIAKLMLAVPNDNAWHQAIIVENILQKKTPATARRMTSLIRKRLELMTVDLWKMVISGTSEVSTQALLASAIKHSKLLGDFLYLVVRQHYKTFNNQMSRKDWKDFLVMCEQKDASIIGWSESTKAKLGQVIFRILAEARYLENTRSMKLLPVTIVSEVRSYLIAHQEKYVIKCMEVAHE